mmetsp:Transcript_70122/g.196261  ORF Transcript_70122/g.196261 Transcript_70122/m.196261 type:complete len:357 (+) Transcript_70122:556-1626(+)
MPSEVVLEPGLARLKKFHGTFVLLLVLQRNVEVAGVVVLPRDGVRRLGALGRRGRHDTLELREPLAAVLTAHAQGVAGLTNNRDLVPLLGEAENLLTSGIERLRVVRQVVVAVETNGVHVVVARVVGGHGRGHVRLLVLGEVRRNARGGVEHEKVVVPLGFLEVVDGVLPRVDEVFGRASVSAPPVPPAGHLVEEAEHHRDGIDLLKEVRDGIKVAEPLRVGLSVRLELNARVAGLVVRVLAVERVRRQPHERHHSAALVRRLDVGHKVALIVDDLGEVEAVHERELARGVLHVRVVVDRVGVREVLARVRGHVVAEEEAILVRHGRQGVFEAGGEFLALRHRVLEASGLFVLGLG